MKPIAIIGQDIICAFQIFLIRSNFKLIYKLLINNSVVITPELEADNISFEAVTSHSYPINWSFPKH